MAESIFDEKRRLELDRKEACVREYYQSCYKDKLGNKIILGKLTIEQIEDLYKSMMKLGAEAYNVFRQMK